MAAEADVADDHFAGMDADTVGHRLMRLGGDLVIEVTDVRGDQRGGTQRLLAGGSAVGAQPEQRQHAVADELIRLTAGVGDSARHCLDKAVDEHDNIEGKPRLAQSR